MLTRRRLLALCIVVATGATGPALAATWDLALDPGASALRFRLKATAHTVEGSFALRAATLRVDTANGGLAGRVVVDAASGDTGNRKRDRKMHERVLESATYPEIVFEPRGFSGVLAPSGTSRVMVQGTLHLHGEPHELTVPVEVRVDGDDLTASAAFEVPYVEWGLEDPSVFLLRVAKTVQVSVEIVARINAP